MAICDAIRFSTCHKHKQALLAIATKGYIMDIRALGRNTAYAICKAKGFKYDTTMKAWLKCTK